MSTSKCPLSPFHFVHIVFQNITIYHHFYLWSVRTLQSVCQVSTPKVTLIPRLSKPRLTKVEVILGLGRPRSELVPTVFYDPIRYFQIQCKKQKKLMCPVEPRTAEFNEYLKLQVQAPHQEKVKCGTKTVASPPLLASVLKNRQMANDLTTDAPHSEGR